MKKTFVLDTNVLLNDFKALYNFEDNDIVLPITVLEELDKFKKGHDTLNYHARQVMRELDKLTEQGDLQKGVPLGDGRGKLFILFDEELSDNYKGAFSEKKADNLILAVADHLRNVLQEPVILVSRDINLRLKAKAIGIEAQDYRTDKIKDYDQLFKETNTYDNFDPELLNLLYQQGYLDLDLCKFDNPPDVNEYFILKSNDNHALVTYYAKDKVIRLVEKHYAYHIKPRNAEQTFAMDALLRDDIQLIALTGPAGTGKTLLALAAALEQSNKFQKIMLARPIVALSDRDLGYLPGSAQEKVRPYMQPLFDNLMVIKQAAGLGSKAAEKIDKMLKEEELIIEPLAFIRGRSLPNIFFIIDEAQNLTPHEIKTIITRAGEGAKLVFTGDVEQIDTPYLDASSNGLSYMTEKMKGQDIFAHIHLYKGERSYLAELASRLL
jgi:PhoH-like ATPase